MAFVFNCGHQRDLEVLWGILLNILPIDDAGMSYLLFFPGLLM